MEGPRWWPGWATSSDESARGCWLQRFSLSPWRCPALAQPVSPEELAFWEAVTQSNRPEEYQAYLDAYPNGRFAALARLRAHAAPQRPAAPAMPAAPTSPVMPGKPPPMPTPGPPQASADPAQASIRLAQSSVRVMNGVTLDLNAQALRDSSNLRLAVMPAGAPDAIADPQRFMEDSTPVRASRQRLTIPAGPPGSDEVRLYHIPALRRFLRRGRARADHRAAGVSGCCAGARPGA